MNKAWNRIVYFERELQRWRPFEAEPGSAGLAFDWLEVADFRR